MKVPYQLVAAMPVPLRNQQMTHALEIGRIRGYGRLKQIPISDTNTISIACYGPSLLDTWQALKPPIISMSGATKFLSERGIIPDFHVDMDPRAHKVAHLKPPIDGVHYLMATVCPPETWEVLNGHRVTLWHTYSGVDDQGKNTYDWVGQHDPGELVLRGGSTIGLTALHIAGVMGYRHFEIHGMDGSYVDASRTSRHAGVHYGRPQQDGITWDAEGVTYHTSKIMANAVQETLNTVKNFPMFCVFHGRGLTQALVRELNVPNACTAEQTEKAAMVRRSYVRMIDVPEKTTNAASYWDGLVDKMNPVAVTELIQFKHKAEDLRKHAKYNTGSIPIETAILLRALCETFKPQVIAEIGTFIGLSTYALRASQALYTCDRDNDCLGANPKEHIITHPYQTSTQMFDAMVANGLEGKVDLFFFDGRIQQADLPLIQRLRHAKSVFAFDDCSNKPGATKGLANLALITPLLKDYALIPPSPAYQGRSTLGALIPMEHVALQRSA